MYDLDRHALYPAVRHEDILHPWVLRVESYPVTFMEKTFQCGFIIHQCHDDLPVLCSILFPDHPQVPIIDPGFCHGTSARSQDVEVPLSEQ